MKTANGREIRVSQVVLAHGSPDGQVAMFSAIARDITERMRIVNELQRQATHDVLTGLPNRIVLEEHLDMELARAAKRVVITAERLVTNFTIRSNPDATNIPFYLVDAVVEVPYGSSPGNMPYLYFSDEEHLAQWMKVEKDPKEFEKFLDHYIYGVSCFEEYLERCGGL